MEIRSGRKESSKEYSEAFFFNANEMDVIRAAAREEIAERARKLNTSSIASLHTKLANKQEGPAGYITGIASDLLQLLGNFSERTNDAVTDIAARSDPPGFANPYIAQRFSWGKIAEELREAITTQMATRLSDGLDEGLERLSDG